MKAFFMHYGMIIVTGALTVLGLMFSTPFAEAVTGSVANFTTGFTRKNVEGIDRVTIGLGDGGSGGSGVGANPYAAQVASVQKLYDVGERNLTASDIITVNGVECYVLQADATKAELITVEIYDQRFDSTFSAYNYADSELKPYMDNFYTNQLGSDPYILDTNVTYRYKIGALSNDFSTYITGTVSQKVFALDAVEAKTNASKFSWDYSGNGYSDIGLAFWVAAGFYSADDSNGWGVGYVGDFYDYYVESHVVGARPAFWISLE